MMDAGPCITFCAVSQQGLLLEVLNTRFELMVPVEVDREVARMTGTRGPGSDFSRVKTNWRKLTENGHIAVLNPEPGTPENVALDLWVKRISGISMGERLLSSKDLGEIMAIAHALALRDQGRETVLLMEDGPAQQIAQRYRLKYVDTVRVMRWAALMGKIPTRAEMTRLYDRMRPHDAALLPIAQTDLLDKNLWRQINQHNLNIASDLP